jgi:hypothetical protein
MTTTEMTEAEADVETRARVYALEAATAELRAEMDRRDLEQIAVESAIELLDRQQSTLRYVLGGLVLATFGRTKDPGLGMIRSLYPEKVAGFENMQAPAMVLERPARRWTQCGTKAELIEKALANGVPSAHRSTREHLVRDLWRRRALPGSVAPRWQVDGVGEAKAS